MSQPCFQSGAYVGILIYTAVSTRLTSIWAIASPWHRLGAHQHISRSASPARSRPSSAFSASCRLRRAKSPPNRASTARPLIAAIARTPSCRGSSNASAHASHTALRRRSSRPSTPIRNGYFLKPTACLCAHRQNPEVAGRSPIARQLNCPGRPCPILPVAGWRGSG